MCLYRDVNIPCRPGEIASSKQRCYKDLTAPHSADKAVPIHREEGKAINSTAIICFFVMKVHKLWYSDTDFTHLIHDPLHLMSSQLNVQWKWFILTLLKTVTVCSSLLLHRDWCGDHRSHRMYKNCSYNAKPLSHIHWYKLVYLKEVSEDSQISPCKFPLFRCWIWAQRGRRRFSTGRRCLSPPMG